MFKGRIIGLNTKRGCCKIKKVADYADYQLMFVEANTQRVSELRNNNDNSKNGHFIRVLQQPLLRLNGIFDLIYLLVLSSQT